MKLMCLIISAICLIPMDFLFFFLQVSGCISEPFKYILLKAINCQYKSKVHQSS